MHNFKELKVWQLSRQLVKDIYEVSSKFPAEKKYNLVSQIRRAAVSIPTNIAEGCGRNTDNDFAHFLNISLGSAYELESLLFLGFDLKLMDESSLSMQLASIEEVQKMIYGLIKSVRAKSYV